MSEEKYSLISLDEIDHEILNLLVKNARSPSRTITDILNKKKIKISDRAVRKRITRLEKGGAIKGYHAQLNYDKVNLPFPRLIMVRFKPSENYRERTGALVQALAKSRFISNVIYVLGEYDLICVGHYATREQASIENVTFRQEFHDIIREYNAYDCTLIKEEMNGHVLT